MNDVPSEMPLKMFTRVASLKMYEISSAGISWLEGKILNTKYTKLNDISGGCLACCTASRRWQVSGTK